MSRLLLSGGELLDPESPEPAAGDLLLREGRIEARLAPGAACPDDARRVDVAALRVAPGFLDLHFHGALVFTDADGMEEALASAASSLPAFGTTAFLPTTVAWADGELAEKVGRLAEASEGAFPGSAAPLGLHLEGPWIHPKAAGAQPAGAIRPFEASEGDEVLARGEGLIRMVTLAPEVAGADELLAALALRDIVPALGHSLADDTSVDRAVERGARHVTHLFNAMGRLHHREPGLAGAALSDERLSFDLICDGAHVHPRMTRLAARAGGERLSLITDRVDPPAAAGASFGSGALRDDGVALRLPDGRLAGSRLTLDRALRNAQAWSGLSLLEAVAACTLRPARVLGVEAERGTLRPGARADLALLDGEGRVAQTWIGGAPVYTRPS